MHVNMEIVSDKAMIGYFRRVPVSRIRIDIQF
jgi:hypothetical protein